MAEIDDVRRYDLIVTGAGSGCLCAGKSIELGAQIGKSGQNASIAAGVVVQPELDEDGADHGLDRLDAQVELAADGGVRHPAGEELEHLLFAWTQALEKSGPPLAGNDVS